MPQLFDVPGWRVPALPSQPNDSEKFSKKRKRPTSDGGKLLSAEFSLEKLMDKLKEKTADAPGSSDDKPKKKKAKGKSAGDAARRQISHPMPLKRGADKAPKDRSPSKAESSRPPKRQKAQHVVAEQSAASSLNSPEEPEENLTAMQKIMRQSLDGAKFRMINENLYKSESQQAVDMMREDPVVYHEYHKGFRRQVQSWPTNPVNMYVEQLQEYPTKTVIADLGCGDAALARTLIPKGMAVLSFDLVSDGKYVVEADACQKLPLPGSEGSGSGSSVGEGQVVDVVVCSLSLMNTNWPRCIREAWRVLKPNGELKIAEVASRFTSVKDFENLISSIGFKLKSKDDSNSHFTLFEFKKVSRPAKSDKDWDNVYGKASILKPCEYKRR